MAFTTISTPTALAGVFVASDSVSSAANNNITGKTSGRIYQVQIDNTQNESQVAYLKIIDSSSTVPGTSIPHLTFYVLGGKKVTYVINTGHPYTSGVSVWCTTHSSVANTSSPSSNVPVTILAS